MSESPGDRRHRAGRIGAVVSLEDVRLRRVAAELVDPGAEGPFEAELQVQPAFAIDEDVVHYTVDYELHASADGEEVMRVSASFSLVYRLPEGTAASEEDLKAFGEVNVLFSAHPYIRELVQTVTGRFGLPPLVLGVLRSPLDRPPPAGPVT